MFASVWPSPLDLYSVRTVALGLAALGAVAGVLGTFAVVRRQALQGDAISHAAIPGVALAFIFGARESQPLLLILGAALAGWFAMALVSEIVQRSRIPFDAALAGALAVFFGFGLVMISYLQKLQGRVPQNGFERWLHPHAQAATHYDLQKYLFGEAAFLSADQAWQIVLLGGLTVLFTMIFWKEFKLVSFDRDFAASIGYPTRLLDLFLTTLIVVAVVLGLRVVGVVLMSAMLVAPATAARQWSNRLGGVATGAALFGAMAGFFGTIASHELNSWKRGVPTGATVVLLATAIVLLSMLFGLRGGRFWFYMRQRAG